jgi:replicative DNA helicase
MAGLTPVRSVLDALLGNRPPPQPERDPTALGTGLEPLDALVGGWRAGEVTLVTGGPATGKSALLYGTALASAASGTPAALVPLKHTARMAMWRLACASAGVELARLLAGALDAADREALAAAAAELEAMPLNVLAMAEPRVEDVADEVGRLPLHRRPRLLVVDGLHALGTRAEDAAPLPPDQRLALVTSALAGLARTTGAAVVASLAAGPGVERAAAHAGRVLEIGAADAGGLVTVSARGTPGAEAPAARLRLDRSRLRFAMP